MHLSKVPDGDSESVMCGLSVMSPVLVLSALCQVTRADDTVWLNYISFPVSVAHIQYEGVF